VNVDTSVRRWPPLKEQIEGDGVYEPVHVAVQVGHQVARFDPRPRSDTEDGAKEEPVLIVTGVLAEVGVIQAEEDLIGQYGPDGHIRPDPRDADKLAEPVPDVVTAVTEAVLEARPRL
jgi:hypothetical protein